MTVVTRHHSANFAIVPNTVADDSRLSFEARGLLCYLLAKPNNWKVRIADIMKAGGIGRDKTYRLLKELREVGYIALDVKRGPGARIEEQNYIVYDCAVPNQLPLPEKPEQAEPLPEKPEVEKLLPENPASGKAVSGKPGRINKNPYLKKHITNNDTFAAFWNGIEPQQRDGHPADCENVWLNLPAEIDRRNAIELWPLFAEIEARRGKTASLSTYLRAKTWRELVDAPPFNGAGEFIITPDREEWEPWLEAIAAKHGAISVSSVKKLGKIVRRDRWPPSVSARQLSMNIG